MNRRGFLRFLGLAPLAAPAAIAAAAPAQHDPLGDFIRSSCSTDIFSLPHIRIVPTREPTIGGSIHAVSWRPMTVSLRDVQWSTFKQWCNEHGERLWRSLDDNGEIV